MGTKREERRNLTSRPELASEEEHLSGTERWVSYQEAKAAKGTAFQREGTHAKAQSWL